MRRILRNERGAAAAETALLLPVVLGLVGSIIFAGWLGTVKTIVNHGARAGARYAAIPATEDLRTWPSQAEVFAKVDAETPLLTPTAVTLDEGAGARNEPMTVEVTYTVSNPIGALLAPLGIDARTINVTSRAEVRRE